MKKYVSLLNLMLRRREKEATFNSTTSSNTFFLQAQRAALSGGREDAAFRDATE